MQTLIDWTHDTDARQRLRRALVRLDPRVRQLDTICEDTDVPLGDVDFNGDAHAIWGSAIRAARAHLRMPAFVAKAAARWPADRELSALAATLDAQPGASTRPQAPFVMGAGAALAEVATQPRDALEAALSELGLIDVTQWLKGFQSAMRCVALIEVGEASRGTGFLVGPDLLLTTWHVVEPIASGSVSPNAVIAHFDYSRSNSGLVNDSVKVLLAESWLLAHSPWSRADITPDAPDAPTDEELDFALLKLDRPIGTESVKGEARRWITLPKHTSPSFGQSVLILQHADGKPLRLALDGVLALTHNRTRLRYRANTLPGASGSPCFDQNWGLLAIHHSGDPHLAAHYNEGIPADTIRAALEKKGISLLPAE